MLMSALLIHLSGGRIETHFHIFGSLAFLACYRDWRVLVAASAVVALDHFVRGVYFPLSVFGVLTASPYLWMEHAAWVVFEDVFLIISIRQSIQEMLGIAERQAALEAVNFGIERTVAERTAELTQEIAERKHAEAEMERMHTRLMDASRQAGMAEVATSVIHNVGNVLNSVNISHSVISDKVRKSKIDSLAKAANLIEEHADDLAAYLTTDPAGQKMPKFLGKLAERLSQEQEETLAELDRSAGTSGTSRKSSPCSRVTPAPAASGNRSSSPRSSRTRCKSTARRSPAIGSRSSASTARCPRPRSRSIRSCRSSSISCSNAKHALIDSGREEKRLVVRTACDDGHVCVSILDNGSRHPEENLTRIFVHGFTTKKDGHGFGLHSGVLAAREMGGSLTVQSAGPGMGATFTLRLPLNQKDDTQNEAPVPDSRSPKTASPRLRSNGHARPKAQQAARMDPHAGQASSVTPGGTRNRPRERRGPARTGNR